MASFGYQNGDLIYVEFKYSEGRNYNTDPGGRPSDDDTEIAIWFGNGSFAFGAGIPTPDDTVVPGSWNPSGTINDDTATPRDVMADNVWQQYANSFTYTGGDVHIALLAKTGVVDSGSENVFIDDIVFATDRLGENDIDNDGIPNCSDTDSDNDGCNDVIEAGHIESTTNPGEVAGTGVDSNGQVTGAATAYAGTNTNVITATQVTVDTAPSAQTATEGDTATFTVAVTATSTTDYSGTAPVTTPNYSGASATDVSGATTYQWYLGDPALGGTALANDTSYSGVDTATLSVVTTLALDGEDYCVVVTHPNNVCFMQTECATLNVSPALTITAENDDFSGTPLSPSLGGTTASVFADNGNGVDDANGSPASDANIDDNISISNAGGLTGVTINTDGTINVPAGSTAGTYTVEYTICLDVDNTICDVANVTIVIAPVVDVSITKTLIDTSPYATGDTVTYALVVSNAGPDTATNIVVSDVPSNLTITSVSGGGCTTFPCTIGSLAPGIANDITIAVTATIDSAGAFSNTASVTSDETDADSSNNLDDGTDGNNDGVAAPVADVSITKTLTDSSPYATGDTVTYTLVVSNVGPDTATNVDISDIPNNLTITSVSGGGCTTFPCTIAAIAPGLVNDVTLTVTATIDSAGNFSNTAIVNADEIDPDTSNNIDDGTDGNNNGTATAVVDVSITKTLVDTSPYATGDTVTYTLVVSNAGPDTATNIVVSDVPSNLTITSVSGGGCTTFPCNIGSLAPGIANDITIAVTATIDSAGAFSNTASVTSDETDADPSNNLDDGTDGNNDGVAAPVADVSITKTLIDSSPYVVGDTVTYTLIVSNAGPDTATNVDISDIPNNLTITSVSGGGCTAFPCTIASIAPGLVNDVTLTVTRNNRFHRKLQ